MLGQAPANKPIAATLHDTFVLTDKQLGQEHGQFSGCTAVVAYIGEEERVMDENGHFVNFHDLDDRERSAPPVSGTHQAPRKRVVRTHSSLILFNIQ